MKIRTAQSTRPDTADAIVDVRSQLDGANPDVILCFSSELYDLGAVATALREMAPGAAVHGTTSCKGALTEACFASREGKGLAVWAAELGDGAAGVGAAPLGNDARGAAGRAAKEALRAAGRSGEAPSLFWLTASPGSEEQVLAGVHDVVGTSIPIVGGSSADNEVAGAWRQFTADGVLENNVVITALFVDCDLGFAFHSGYAPTEVRAEVTRAEGRTALELNDQPAAHVYQEWTGALGDAVAGGNVLAKTTLHPLARVAGRIGDVDVHVLSHPEQVTPGGGLVLFTDVEEGDQFILMEGSRDSLVTRAGRVARSAADGAAGPMREIHGALMVYCGGCMLTVEDRMDEVAQSIADELGDAPRAALFSFGEQGSFAGLGNRHGNLMISAVVFGER
jgi:hypothetical protein